MGEVTKGDWYLADVFGSKAIVESLDEIDRCGTIDRAQTAAARFWLKGLENGARRGEQPVAADDGVAARRPRR
jgi:hypothetical protein